MKLKDRLTRLLALRSDPRPLVRLAWWGVAAVLMALLISPVKGGEALRAVWGTWNIGLLLYTLVRSIPRIRGVFRGSGAAIRWAFWGSFLVFVWVNLAASRSLSLFARQVSLPASFADFSFLLGLVLAPISFVLLFFVSLIGAAFGVVGAGNREEEGPAATAGVSRFWIAVTFVVVLVAVGRALQLPDVTLFAAPMGVPTFLVLMGKRADAAAGSWDVGREFGRVLTRWCIFRGRVGRRIRYCDLRGPVLGLTAGLITLAFHSLTVLEPLQSAELLQIVRMQAAIPFQSVGVEAAYPKGVTGIVLLNMDEHVRARIDREGSEADTQAALIRRLKALGALRVVLPAPVRQAEDPARFLHFGTASTEPDRPPVNNETVQRGRRDLPVLVAAMRQAGNVTLIADDLEPSDDEPQPRSERGGGPPPPPRPPSPGPLSKELRTAAAEIALGELPTLTHPQLPVIPLDSAPLPTVPVSLYLSALGRPLQPTERRNIPQIQPGRVLVAYPNARAGLTFPTVDYSTVLAGREIYRNRLAVNQRKLSDEGAWLTPEAFFRGKIVFLDSLQPAYRESPVGMMPESELLALATRTLLSRGGLRAVHPAWQLLVTLLLPALVGWVCAGLDPFGAGWRVALTAGILATTATLVGLFPATQVWLDAAAPLVACIGAYLMTTQLTYHTNESDRDLLRRFAAPQVVEELLRRPDMLALGGSRQKLCVLFADVRGFTTFTERHRDEPERVIETINAYTSAMTETLFEFKGVLDKYTGDGLMAFFPVEPNEEDEACVERSVRAALAMRDATDVVTARLRAADLQPLHVGIGLHFGEAVVGLVGNLNQFNYTALGFTVVVAARLQTLAEGGQVIVSPEVEQMIHPGFETQAMNPVEVKGVSEPVTPYRVLRLRLEMAEGQRVPQLAAGSVHGEP